MLGVKVCEVKGEDTLTKFRLWRTARLMSCAKFLLACMWWGLGGEGDGCSKTFDRAPESGASSNQKTNKTTSFSELGILTSKETNPDRIRLCHATCHAPSLEGSVRLT